MAGWVWQDDTYQSSVVGVEREMHRGILENGELALSGRRCNYAELTEGIGEGMAIIVSKLTRWPNYRRSSIRPTKVVKLELLIAWKRQDESYSLTAAIM